MYSSLTIFFGHKVHSAMTDKYRAATQNCRCTYEVTFRPLITACTLGSHTSRWLSTGGNHIYYDGKKHWFSHIQSTVQISARCKVRKHRKHRKEKKSKTCIEMKWVHVMTANSMFPLLRSEGWGMRMKWGKWWRVDEGTRGQIGERDAVFMSYPESNAWRFSLGSVGIPNPCAAFNWI